MRPDIAPPKLKIRATEARTNTCAAANTYAVNRFWHPGHSSHPDGQSTLKAHSHPREVRQGSHSSLAIPKDRATVTLASDPLL